MSARDTDWLAANPPDAAAIEGSLLRVLICGGVDDGKSTLLGRLLKDSGVVPDEQLAAWRRRSEYHGTTAGAPDPELLVEGLTAEAEQGIAIDIAHYFAATPHRRLIIADCPGHEQYTRNMATAAFTADVAVVLVDVRRGVLRQTRRHTAIATMMGVRQVVLAVNKMDLVGFAPAPFEAAVAAFRAVLDERVQLQAIPIGALGGHNVVHRSAQMRWYDGPSLLEHLDEMSIPEAAAAAFRMAVQWVKRPHDGFRGYAGTVASGVLQRGQRVRVASSGRIAAITRVLAAEGEVASAAAGRAVTVVIAPDTDVPVGEVLSDADDPVEMSDQFHARMLWLHDDPLVPGRSYLVRVGTRTVTGSITRIRHPVDPERGAQVATEALELNDIAMVNLALDAAVGFESFTQCRALGGFIVIDRQSYATVGVGTIGGALRKASNLAWQALDVDRSARARLKRQSPAVVWFTGLPGAGKSTIANLVERRLHAEGRHTYLLDGDNVRHGLNRDLGFCEADRVENLRRVSEVAALFADAGLIVLVAFIAPYRAERDAARARLPDGEFLEVFVDTSVAECRRRDPKGLYRKADTGKLQNFTGVNAPYEPPVAPDLHLRTEEESADLLAERVVEALHHRIAGRAGTL